MFRIFDHWSNFARLETSYRPAEPADGKSLLQRVFEARLDLAEVALRNSEVEVFGEVIDLIAGDIAALPEESIAVREKWREKGALGQREILEAFAPSTVARLGAEIAPLMQWRYVRGSADALALDLLVTRVSVGQTHDCRDQWQFGTPRHVIRLMVDMLEPDPSNVVGTLLAARADSSSASWSISWSATPPQRRSLRTWIRIRAPS